MASSTCPKCGNHLFEIKEAEPYNSAFILMFVQCSSCGAVVGAVDYHNIGAMLEKQNEAIKRIARAVNVSVDL